MHYSKLCLLFILAASNAFALTLNSSQSDYSTTENIATTVNNTAGSAIYSTFSGTSSLSRKINNLHSISTLGTSAYGIRVTGDYNEIKNSGTITTLNSSSRGISSSGDFIKINNSGSIQTFGSTAYGIYLSAGTNSKASSSNFSSVENNGSISSADAHGIYTNDAFTAILNNGTISSGLDTTDYGVRIDGRASTFSNFGQINSTKYAIYNDADAVVINNYGALNGGIRLKGATLNIYSGSIGGEIDDNESGTINIFTNHAQTNNYNDLANLNIKSGVFEANNKIIASSINIESGATFKINPFATINFDQISGGGNLEVASGTKFIINKNLAIANIIVGGELDLSSTNNLDIQTNISSTGSAQINIGANNHKIAGNLALGQGDKIIVGANSNGFGSLETGGAAIISSETKLIISSSGRFLKNGDKIKLISGGENSSISNPSQIELNNCKASRCGLLRLVSEVDGNSLNLVVNRLSSKEIGVSRNHKNLYQGLSGASASGKMAQFLNNLDNKNLSDSELEQNLSQLSPSSARASAINNLNTISGSLKTGEIRLNQIRNFESITSKPSLNLGQIFNQNQKIDHLNLNNFGGTLENGMWIQPFGGAATQDQNSEEGGYKNYLSGIAFGVDRQFSKNSLWGGSFSLARSEVKSFDSLKRISAVTYQFNIFNSRNYDDFFVDYLGGISYSQFDSNRAIPSVNTTASAKYHGVGFIGKIKAGKNFAITPEISAIPEISLSLNKNSNSAHQEKGADELNLKVGKSSSKIGEARIGSSLNWAHKIRSKSEFEKVGASIRGSYGYNFINNFSDINSSFSDQNSSFVTKTSALDPSSIQLGFELNALHEDNTIFGIDYQLDHRKTYQSHLVSLKIRQEF